MSKHKITWKSPALGGREITFVRYGVSGTPLLLFPTAGGDAEEPERFHLITAIGDFLKDLRLKVYVVDSIAGQAWLKECKTLEQAAKVQNQFDQCVVREIVPAIQRDCGGQTGRIWTAGRRSARSTRWPRSAGTRICSRRRSACRAPTT